MGLESQYNSVIMTNNALPFGSVYLYELYFPAVTDFDIKCWSKLKIEPGLESPSLGFKQFIF